MILGALYLAIAGIGLWFAVAKKASYPRAFTFASVGFSLLLLYSLLLIAYPIWMTANSDSLGASGARMGEITAYWNTAGVVLQLIAVIALARSVFADRAQ